MTLGPGPGRLYVVVSGPPASGKTTLARGLAAGLGLPLFSKDTIKERLADVLGAANVEESRRIGGAAIAVLLAVAEESGCGVLESVWRRSMAIPDLTGLKGTVVEVFCRCRPALAQARYLERAPHRAAGHFDSERLGDDSLWTGETAEPIAGPWPVLEVDTEGPVAMTDVVREVQLAASRARSASR